MNADGRRPILAHGRTAATTVSAGGSIGDKAFTLASASGWSVDKLIFVSESGGTEAEYLGTVQSIDGADIVSEFGLVAAKSSNMKIWQPAYYAEMGTAQTDRPLVEQNDGVSESMTLNNIVHRVQTRDPMETLTFGFSDIATSVRLAFRTFWTNTSGVNYGVSATDMVWAGWDYEADAASLWTVRAMGQPSDFRESLYGRSGIVLRLLLLTQSAYPA